MRKLTHQDRRLDAEREDVERDEATREEVEEVLDALLHSDRAQHDELGRTRPVNVLEEANGGSHSSPREQPAAPIDLGNVDE